VSPFHQKTTSVTSTEQMWYSRACVYNHGPIGVSSRPANVERCCGKIWLHQSLETAFFTIKCLFDYGARKAFDHGLLAKRPTILRLAESRRAA
jgi:hypothetical protein